MVPTVDRGFFEVDFWSIDTAGDRPSMKSTSGLSICPRNWRAYADSDSTYRRCPSAKIVSNARDDLPEPESPVKTTRLSRGSSTEMSLRLCSRAPRTMRWSCWGRGAADGREEGTAVTRFMLGARTDSRCIAAYGGRHGDPDRGLRGARRHGDGRPREPRRLHRLALPAALRLARLFRRPAGHAGERPLAHRARGARTYDAPLPGPLVRARDHPRDRGRGGEGDRPHAARGRPGGPDPPGPGGARDRPDAPRVGRAVQLRPDPSLGVPGPGTRAGLRGHHRGRRAGHARAARHP